MTQPLTRPDKPEKDLRPGQLRPEVNFTLVEGVDHNPGYRPVQQVSLGCHVKGVALPHVDHTDPETVLLGQNRRVCFQPPKPERQMIKKFGAFVQEWIEKNLVPLKPSTDTSFETWLANTNYTEARKQELRLAQSSIDGILDKRHSKVGGFVKDETYPTYKNARGINARTDAFKGKVGPVFKLIEKELFQNKWFIKYVPVPERPRVIQALYDEALKYFATDHTSYEGHFTLEVMKECEFRLYDYMSQNLDCHTEFMEYLNGTIGGMNYVKFKQFEYNIEATRMTGEMCTSLGNGFTNLMLILFVCRESGVEHTDGKLEGDDSLFGIPIDTTFKEEIFKQLGFTIKIEECANIHEASFCGNIYAPEDLNIITDPIESLIGFGWTKSKYLHSKNFRLMGLLRSKALSMLYEYRGCPILRELALYVLRCTEGIRARSTAQTMWERDQEAMRLDYMKKNPDWAKVSVGKATRLLVEKLFRIPVELQLKYEAYLRSLNTIQPLDLTLFGDLIHTEVVDYGLRYMTKVNFKLTSYELNHPNIVSESQYYWGSQYLNKVNRTRLPQCGLYHSKIPD